MKTIITSLAIAIALAPVMRAQENSASPAEEANQYPEVPKDYEVGESTVSPDGRFAILYERRDENSNVDPGLPNLLVRLKPYAELKEIENDQGVTWKDGRGAPDAKWNGNSTVAIWHAMKWGHVDLAVYEIENDEVKRVQKIWPRDRQIYRSRFSRTVFEEISEGTRRLQLRFRFACERVGIQGSQAPARYICRQQTEPRRRAALDGRAAGHLESRHRQVRQGRFSTGQDNYSETRRLRDAVKFHPRAQ